MRCTVGQIWYSLPLGRRDPDGRSIQSSNYTSLCKCAYNLLHCSNVSRLLVLINAKTHNNFKINHLFVHKSFLNLILNHSMTHIFILKNKSKNILKKPAARGLATKYQTGSFCIKVSPWLDCWAEQCDDACRNMKTCRSDINKAYLSDCCTETCRPHGESWGVAFFCRQRGGIHISYTIGDFVDVLNIVQLNHWTEQFYLLLMFWSIFLLVLFCLEIAFSLTLKYLTKKTKIYINLTVNYYGTIGNRRHQRSSDLYIWNWSTPN